MSWWVVSQKRLAVPWNVTDIYITFYIIRKLETNNLKYKLALYTNTRIWKSNPTLVSSETWGIYLKHVAMAKFSKPESLRENVLTVWWASHGPADLHDQVEVPYHLCDFCYNQKVC